MFQKLHGQTGRMPVILVEGESDRNAVLMLARRAAINLDSADVVAMGGAARFEEHLDRYDGTDLRGLCDEGEVAGLARALGQPDLSVEGLGRIGFFVCVRDLEEELIRANGVERVLEVIDSEGETRTFEKFQLQPEWRTRAVEDQLRRFIGTRAGRKVRMGGLLASSVELDRIPPPLRSLLDSL